jgi:hypothetical protein
VWRWYRDVVGKGETVIGDVSTLANPEVVDTIRYQVQAEKVEQGEVPRALSEQELDEIRAFGTRSSPRSEARRSRAPGHHLTPAAWPPARQDSQGSN